MADDDPGPITTAGGPQPVTVGPGQEDDLPAIAAILNDAILTSNATLETQPRPAAERLGWFRRFAATGPYRLLVARQGDHTLGYAASQPYRDHPGFGETVEISIALDARRRSQAAIRSPGSAARPGRGGGQRRRGPGRAC